MTQKRTRKTFTMKMWMIILLTITFLQMGTLAIVDYSLKPPVLNETYAAEDGEEKDEGTTIENTLEPPAEALEYVKNPSSLLIAYTTSEDELVIADENGPVFQEEVGKVSYLTWLGNSNTLFYAVQGKSLQAYLLPHHTLKPVFLKKWTGDERVVVETHFSPYLEILYVHIKNGKNSEIYRYLATQGMNKVPLPNLSIERITYDDKTDVHLFTDEKGETWRYENQHLYKPDGSVVRESVQKKELPKEYLK